MTLPQAIKVLKKHNKWHKGDTRIKQTGPKELSEALDIAIHLLEQLENNGKRITGVNFAEMDKVIKQ